MTTISQPAEFTLQREHIADRSTAVKWIVSHATRYWPILIMIFIGGLGNAALAAVVPVLVGDAFNQMLKPNPDTSILLPLALTLGGSQIVRGVLQLGRNFGAELIAQKIERDIRDELYISLLGKSMTFHNLQPVGDTMARATNDVREVNFMFSPGLNLVVGSFMFLVMPFIFAPQYNVSLILTPALFAVAYFIALANYLKTLSPITDEDHQDDRPVASGVRNDPLDGVAAVSGMFALQGEFSRLGNSGHSDDRYQRENIEIDFTPLLCDE